MSATTVFFRDDDVGEMTAELEQVQQLFLDAGVPVNYQVIPVWLDAAAAAELVARRREHPELVHLNQHGFRHEQVLRGKRRWSEFAGGRPYEDQRADIDAGRARLQELLGEAVDVGVFTPPNHKYDRNTLRALQQGGVEILSSSFYPSAAPQLVYRAGRLARRTAVLGRAVSAHGGVRPEVPLYELSISVRLDDDGGNLTGGVAEWLNGFQAARARTDRVGFMLHHAAFRDDAGRTSLGDLVRRLGDDPDVSFADLRTIHAAA